MEQQKSKKALKFALLFFLIIGISISLLPYSAKTCWRNVYSFFGLNDFTAAADGSPLSVHVLDVGKADSIFIECEGKYMLVDGGTMDRGEQITEYMERRGVKKLEYVVNTHPDDDHIGGLSKIIQSFDVGCYMAPKIPAALIPSTEEYTSVQFALSQKHLTVKTPQCGENFTLGKLNIQVLGPVKAGTNTNNNSIVLRLSYGDIHFLLMGDAEKEEEADLLASHADLSADVLKVGHHGSNTSTTYEFLQKVHPRYAGISVANDTNHLPKKNVLKRLNDTNVPVYRTDIYGTLIFLSDGHSVQIVTEKKKP